MYSLSNVPAIRAIGQQLDRLMDEGVISAWQLPYEQLLTRLSAAIFFLTPVEESLLPAIWQELGAHEGLRYRLNEEKTLSVLEWRVEFKREA